MAIGLPFSGDASDEVDANDYANADVAASSTPSGALVVSMEELLIEAVVRSPSVDDEGWRLTSSVGSLFHQLAPQATNKIFRHVKKALIDAKRLQMRRDGLQICICGA